MTAVLSDADRNPYQGEHVADEDTAASFHVGECPGGCEECGTAPLSGPACVLCGLGVPSGAGRHDDCRPRLVSGHVVTTLTIVSTATDWWVEDVDNDHLHWQPSTEAEARLTPDDFAKQVAARLGAVYVEPKPAVVMTPCRSCGVGVSTLRSKPTEDVCWFCVQGAVTAAERDELLERLRVGTLGSLRWSDSGESLLAEAPVAVGRAA